MRENKKLNLWAWTGIALIWGTIFLLIVSAFIANVNLAKTSPFFDANYCTHGGWTGVYFSLNSLVAMLVILGFSIGLLFVKAKEVK